jgi:hypothetical protein
MAEYGSTPSQIASLLGHADGGVLTLRTYIHADLIDSPDFIDGVLAQVREGSTPGSTPLPKLSESSGT